MNFLGLFVAGITLSLLIGTILLSVAIFIFVKHLIRYKTHPTYLCFNRDLFSSYFLSRVKERFYLGSLASIDIVPIQERKENVGQYDNGNKAVMTRDITLESIERYLERNTSDESNTTTEEEQELLPLSSLPASKDKPHICKHDTESRNNNAVGKE